MEKFDLSFLKQAKNKYFISYIDFEKIVTKDYLWNFRNNNHFTQNRLANILNVSKKTIEKWEQGANPIKGSSAVLIYLLNEHPEIMDYIYKEEEIKECPKEEKEIIICDIPLNFANTSVWSFATDKHKNGGKLNVIQQACM